ncbi:hypothetical protein GCM10007067_01240 [Lysobacter bugurensis]|uniref:Anti-sigma factor NepR domain-containing protein n=1 Tax=Cognatilysobacter bugurensis TaxID=543356 RepID=A0A918SSD9_9GAMM|nr:hypothetical protein GCM10007067_01240 [Lysobacter bugurensis]
MRGAFDDVLEEPVPDRLTALLRNAAGDAASSSADVIPLARRDTGRRAADTPAGPTVATAAPPAPDAARRVPPPIRARARGGWASYALAASVAALAVSLWLRPAPGSVYVDDGMLVARGALAEELDTTLASAPSEAGALAIGLSFRDADGRVCRSFVQRGERAIAGLACRDGDRWALPVLSAAEAVAAGEVRQASSAVTPEVQAAIDARLQGDVFDAAQERAARDAGWR